ncbi:hypothetical protein ACN42_g11552, partial [Penicillium freii]
MMMHYTVDMVLVFVLAYLHLPLEQILADPIMLHSAYLPLLPPMSLPPKSLPRSPYNLESAPDIVYPPP